MARPPRRYQSPTERAEAVFKPANPALDPVAPKPVRTGIPVGKETVSLSLDRDVLDHFQDDGPGWQARINVALRNAAGLD
jgi:uncharacterized protein (DUF4415 family)